MGWLARSHGLQTNSLTAIELVTADGELVRTDADNDPELFWALRGGGGNFGIVTALEFRLYPVTRGLRRLHDLGLDARPSACCPVYAAWAAHAPDHVTTSFRIMQLPPLPEIPEPIRGRAIVMIDGAVQGDPAVIEPLRALAPEIDTFAMMPAPALVRLHQDPEEPMPYAGDTALLEDAPGRGGRGAAADGRPEARARRWRSSSCASSAARWPAATPGHGAVAGIDAEFVLFLCGMALDADMGAVHARPHRGPREGRAGAVERRRASTSTSPRTQVDPSAPSAPTPGRGCRPSRPASTRRT